jgi:small conductance mechanosensitive channel
VAPDKSPASPLGERVIAFSDQLGLALSGDPVMLRSLTAALAAFSIRIMVAGLILTATVWAANRLARLAGRGIERLNRRHTGDRTLAVFISGLVKYVVIAVGLVAVLQQLGIQTTSVIAVLGAASLAIGLALQGTLGNVAAGVMILLLRPYRLGDKVELNGRQGVVTGMDLFNTRLRDYDGMTLFLPNGKVFGDMIVNVSQAGRRRVELHFGIDYDDDLDTALGALLEIAKAEPRVLADPPPWAKVTGLADSSVTVTLRCWTAVDEWVDTRFDLTKRVKETFDARGLRFPYPHQVTVERGPATPPHCEEITADAPHLSAGRD